MQNQPWLDDLIAKKILKTDIIIDAFKNVKREDFLPDNLKIMAEIDAALPLIKGQTISQPTTVAIMLELLSPEQGLKVLDIGTGSGWQAALIAWAVGKNGKVYTIETIEELVNFAKERSLNYRLDNIEFILGDGKQGLPNFAPFDRIVAACYAPEVPAALLEQLSDKYGRLVMPVGEPFMQDIILVVKNKGQFSKKYFPGFVFVPLI